MLYQEFLALMTRLRACYPARVMDDSLWKANTLRYHAELKAFKPQVLVRAFEGAWRKHRTFFPALGEIEELCVIARRDMDLARPALTDLGEPFAFAQTPEGQEARQRAFEMVAIAMGETFEKAETP